MPPSSPEARQSRKLSDISPIMTESKTFKQEIDGISTQSATKLKSQGQKSAFASVSAVNAVPIIIFFIKKGHEINPLYMVLYFALLSLIMILGFIEPFLLDYFSRSKDLSEQIETHIMITIKQVIYGLTFFIVSFVAFLLDEYT